MEIFKPTLVPLDNYLHSNIHTEKYVIEKVDEILLNEKILKIVENIISWYVNKNFFITYWQLLWELQNLSEIEINLIINKLSEIENHFKNTSNKYEDLTKKAIKNYNIKIK